MVRIRAGGFSDQGFPRWLNRAKKDDDVERILNLGVLIHQDRLRVPFRFAGRDRLS